MTRFCSLMLSLLLVVLASSCAQRLPDANDMDRYYDMARIQLRGEEEAINRLRAEGKLDDAAYAREKKDLENKVSRKAATLALVGHNLRKKQMEAQGIPTPDHPQDISVPQAGSLPTGSDFHRFNSTQMGSQNGTTINDMRQMMGDFRPGSNVRPASGAGGY